MKNNRVLFHLKRVFNEAIGRYPLHSAAKSGDLDKYYKACGQADIRDFYTLDEEGKTVWKRAHEGKNQEIFSMVFAGMANCPVPKGKENIRKPLEISSPHIGFSRARIKW